VAYTGAGALQPLANPAPPSPSTNKEQRAAMVIHATHQVGRAPPPPGRTPGITAARRAPTGPPLPRAVRAVEPDPFGPVSRCQCEIAALVMSPDWAAQVSSA
jgi:hypothetical protein